MTSNRDSRRLLRTNSRQRQATAERRSQYESRNRIGKLVRRSPDCIAHHRDFQRSCIWPQVKPGDFITPDNANKVKDLVSPGQYLRVLHGMTIKVTPTERIDWPPPYKDATEKYSSQVRLTPDHRSLVGYVAGEPFPIVDANDPDAGTKVMWNVAFRPISSDEYDLRWFDCDSVYWGKNASFREITDIEVGHYAGYNEVGRTEVDPMPIDPDFKKTGRYFLGLLYPVLSPQDARAPD